MANSDKRCVECNWLNKEVGDNFVCSNCGEGTIIQEKEEVTKDIKKSKLNLDLIK